ncbi:MAG: hypothetical protein ACREFQ_05240, partial [Stellaceae bacterium]
MLQYQHFEPPLLLVLLSLPPADRAAAAVWYRAVADRLDASARAETAVESAEIRAARTRRIEIAGDSARRGELRGGSRLVAVEAAARA